MTKEDIKNYVDMALTDADINLLSYLVSDEGATVDFIKESTDPEFAVMADYFEDMVYMTQSKALLCAIRDRFCEMTDQSLDLRYICEQIQYADEVFPTEEY